MNKSTQVVEKDTHPKKEIKRMVDAALYHPCTRRFIGFVNKSRERLARKASAEEKKKQKAENKAVTAIEDAALILWPIAVSQGLSDSTTLRIRRLLEFTPVFDVDTRLEDPDEKELEKVTIEQ